MRVASRHLAPSAIAALLAAGTLAPPAAAQYPIGETRVVVSRREARVTFPPDTSRAWGWPARGSGPAVGGYHWNVLVETPEPRAIGLSVRPAAREDAARAFSSLSALVAAGEAELCEPGMIRTCRDAHVTASVVGRSVVLAIRDSAVVASLFWLRPDSVRAGRHTPTGAPGSGETVQVRVRYVEPQIPKPTAAQIAEGARRRRRYEEEINSVSRSIGGGTSHGALWLAVGDTATLSLRETHCTYDVCHGGMPVGSGSERWTIADTGVVARLVPDADTSLDARAAAAIAGATIRLVALRAGRTSVRVDGLPRDDSPSRHPIARSLAREVVVTLPVHGVELLPLPDTLAVGETLEVRARATDDRGDAIEGAPVAIVVRGGGYGRAGSGPEPLRERLDEPGVRTVIATFASRADTAIVVVVPPRR